MPQTSPRTPGHQEGPADSLAAPGKAGGLGGTRSVFGGVAEDCVTPLPAADLVLQFVHQAKRAETLHDVRELAQALGLDSQVELAGVVRHTNELHRSASFGISGQAYVLLELRVMLAGLLARYHGHLHASLSDADRRILRYAAKYATPSEEAV